MAVVRSPEESESECFLHMTNIVPISNTKKAAIAKNPATIMIVINTDEAFPRKSNIWYLHILNFGLIGGQSSRAEFAFRQEDSTAFEAQADF